MKKRTFRILEIKRSGTISFIVQQKHFPFKWLGIKYATWNRDLDYYSLTYDFESMDQLKNAIQEIRDRIALRKEDYTKVIEEFEIES